MSKTEPTPVDKIRRIIEDSRAKTFIIAVGENHDDGMDVILATKGSIDDQVELIASIIRRMVDNLKIPPDMTKVDITAAILSRLTRYTTLGEDKDVSKLE